MLKRLLALVAIVSLVGFGGMAFADDSCEWALDAECDYDSGLCELGTDSDDCGDICENSCGSALDGECDDGGADSLYDICDWGSDCGDCGVRWLED